MTQRRWVPTFGPALIAILSSHDCCNSAAISSSTIMVFICAPWPTPARPWVTAGAAAGFLCVTWCPQLTDLHGPWHPWSQRSGAHSLSLVFGSGSDQAGCTGALLTWPPKAIKNQLSHQTRLSKLFLCLTMVAQRGKTAAYKPLPFFLLLTFPGQAVCPWFLCWKRYIPEIKDRQKTQPLPSELNHTARAGVGILLPLPKPSCSKGSSKEDFTLSSLSVRDALQRLHKTAWYSSKPRWLFPLSLTKVSRCQLFNFSWQTTQAGISTISWTI